MLKWKNQFNNFKQGKGKLHWDIIRTRYFSTCFCSEINKNNLIRLPSILLISKVRQPTTFILTALCTLSFNLHGNILSLLCWIEFNGFEENKWMCLVCLGRWMLISSLYLGEWDLRLLMDLQLCGYKGRCFSIKHHFMTMYMLRIIPKTPALKHM